MTVAEVVCTVRGGESGVEIDQKLSPVESAQNCCKFMIVLLVVSMFLYRTKKCV